MCKCHLHAISRINSIANVLKLVIIIIIMHQPPVVLENGPIIPSIDDVVGHGTHRLGLGTVMGIEEREGRARRHWVVAHRVLHSEQNILFLLYIEE